MKVLSRDDVLELVGIGGTTLWRWERAGRFPRRRQLGPGRVGWLQSEVDAWLKSRPVAESSEGGAGRRAPRGETARGDE